MAFKFPSKKQNSLKFPQKQSIPFKFPPKKPNIAFKLPKIAFKFPQKSRPSPSNFPKTAFKSPPKKPNTAYVFLAGRTPPTPSPPSPRLGRRVSHYFRTRSQLPLAERTEPQAKVYSQLSWLGDITASIAGEEGGGGRPRAHERRRPRSFGVYVRFGAREWPTDKNESQGSEIR